MVENVTARNSRLKFRGVFARGEGGLGKTDNCYEPQVWKEQ